MGPAPTLSELGIDPTVLADPDGTVRHEDAIALWGRAVEITGDDALGLHAAEQVDVSVLDVQGYAAMSSATLREGMERARRLHRLSHEASRVGLFEGQDGFAWRHELPGGAHLPRQPAQFAIALALVVARQPAQGEHVSGKGAGSDGRGAAGRRCKRGKHLQEAEHEQSHIHLALLRHSVLADPARIGQVHYARVSAGLTFGTFAQTALLAAPLTASQNQHCRSAATQLVRSATRRFLKGTVVASARGGTQLAESGA